MPRTGFAAGTGHPPTTADLMKGTTTVTMHHIQGAALPGSIPTVETAAAPSVAALFGTWSELMRAAVELGSRCNAAQDTADSIYPEPPASSLTPEGLAVTVEILASWGFGPSSKEVQAHEQWEARCDAIDAVVGLPALVEQSHLADSRTRAVAAQILTAKPVTPQEAAMKYRVITELANDITHEEARRLFEKFQSDLDRLAQAA